MQKYSFSGLYNKHIYFQCEVTSCFAVFSISGRRLIYLITDVFTTFFHAGYSPHFNYHFDVNSFVFAHHTNLFMFILGLTDADAVRQLYP